MSPSCSTGFVGARARGALTGGDAANQLERASAIDASGPDVPRETIGPRPRRVGSPARRVRRGILDAPTLAIGPFGASRRRRSSERADPPKSLRSAEVTLQKTLCGSLGNRCEPVLFRRALRPTRAVPFKDSSLA